MCLRSSPGADNLNIPKQMKATIASVALILSLLGASLTAADPKPATLSAEQQFHQADVQLAVEQYKKLRMAAFDIALKTQTENALSEDQLKQLNDTQAKLEARAELLRAETLKAAVAIANPR
jgi:hypothetical protein